MSPSSTVCLSCLRPEQLASYATPHDKRLRVWGSEIIQTYTPGLWVNRVATLDQGVRLRSPQISLPEGSIILYRGGDTWMHLEEGVLERDFEGWDAVALGFGDRVPCAYKARTTHRFIEPCVLLLRTGKKVEATIGDFLIELGGVESYHFVPRQFLQLEIEGYDRLEGPPLYEEVDP